MVLPVVVVVVLSVNPSVTVLPSVTVTVLPSVTVMSVGSSVAGFVGLVEPAVVVVGVVPPVNQYNVLA